MSDIEIQNLSFGYNKELVLKDINLSYNKKEMLAIIGPNGGGKSTILKLILGLLQPQKGSVKIKKGINLSYVPQNTNTNKEFPVSVLDVVLMGRLKKRKFGFFGSEDKKRAKEALEAVSMQEYGDKNIAKLSGGQRQRVFIARALCAQADILLLDEPTASLDKQSQQQVYDLLKKLNKEVGVIIVSHDTTVLLGYATKIAHINQTLHLHGAITKTREDFDSDHICPVELIHAGCDHV
ncbi:MAG: metal ABC transporter ATP-binding protein [Campylobacterota bacterium]